ncbi:tetratricopeptide repeat protein [Teredinibacter sp. KSP-S5-2]|uniref:tetratricopeptide repeat protein n=1 Tax=Teredinibacter sp. KSP-S5-2 TaxID=3034506 RepID=UPI0029345492|nr:tetratricopeptide repeat protein [Teredinibacter sp. KSP-S5-2]WNO10722.1 tetratricopeptide repeat protein [Teredinibacter sp. KSP-S5-2]
MLVRVFTFFLLIVLVGCGASPKKNTIGHIKRSDSKKEEKVEFKKMNHQEVREEYQELLSLFEDDKLKEQIERRIADVYMMEGVQDQLDSKPEKSYYQEAIKSYREVLEKYPNSPENAEVFYQLAKAYDMEGKQEETLKMLNELTSRHPDYPFNPEAYFRKGDIYFNKADYANAERAYLAVTRYDNAKLQVNAHYMLGWAYYKQNRFNSCLKSFAHVLNELLAEQMEVGELNATKSALINDTLHSMSLALSKLGGAEAIGHVNNLADKPYVWMVYQDLGQYYLDKERFEDSANTFRLFVSRTPESNHAPMMHKRLIDTYIKGGFPKQAMAEKENYVASYGIYSKYKMHLAASEEKLGVDLTSTLKEYIDELARMYHAKGQGYRDSMKKLEAANNKPNKAKYAKADKDAIEAFDKASGFYQQFIDTFPQDETVGEMTFLKADALFSAYRYEPAITEYEKVAYEIQGDSMKKRGATAGYAAIVSYQKYIDSLEKEKAIKQWQARAVESMLRFSEVYHQDERSPSVLTRAAEYLFGLEQYERALQVSSDLIAHNQNLSQNLKKTAYGIMAHSYFKLGNYQGAEESYLNQRNLVNQDGEEYTRISEQLASAIYKKSEGMIAEEQKDQAATQLLKIKTLTPNSKIRVTAQYDAATLLLELKQWQAAVVELQDLMANFPEHELAAEFPRKIAFAHENQELWGKAAESYMYLYQNDKDAEIQREALFAAADMYERDGQHERAIEKFKRYAYHYEQPFDTRMEARYRLATNYGKIDDENKKLYWLRRIIDGDKKGGDQRTDRSRWLGAWANMEYGDYFASEFSRRKLRLPLNKSIVKKNEMLQNATERYQMAADYGILEFVTSSSFKIAGLYQKFASELRGAPIPSGLSSQDKQAYMGILEEQALPFMQLAVDLHQGNIERAWDGKYNNWIENSFAEMRKLQPARYNKQEATVNYGEGIR